MAEKEPQAQATARETATNGDAEKQLHQPQSQAQRVHEFQEAEGYVVDVDTEATSNDGGLKVAKDGHTRLIPQPSDDPNDPLNWSWGKKHVILFVISWASFLPDFGSATGAVTLIPQAAEYGTTPDIVNHSQAGNVFMLGAGGVIVVLLSAYFGRLPVVFWFLLISMATAAWCAGATSFDSFMAARILNGFFSTVTQAGGLMFIQDIFFFHERARKINIWSSFIIISPYMGPLLGAFITMTKHWSVAFWVYFAMNVLAVGLVIAFLQETYYDRSIPANEQPARGSRIARLTGVAQLKSRHLRNTLGQACWRTVSVILKPVILISCIFYCLTFAWAVGINTTLAIFVADLYGFGPRQTGFFYFTPFVAVILGQLIGHWLHDANAKQYIRTHKGHFEPEVRLRVIYITMPLVIIGLVIFGQCMANGWHYMATAVVWGLYVFGMMIVTVALNSYCLDSYPEASGEVCAWLNFSRTLGGFIVSYFQVRWALASGTKVSFGIQGGICAAAIILIVILQVWGKKMRVWAVL